MTAKKLLIVVFALFSASEALADSTPRYKTIPSLGWSLDRVVDVTSAGTVTGVDATFESGTFTEELSIPHSTTLPGTCSPGDVYMDTDADSDGSLYICVATNTWKENDDDAGDITSVGDCASGDCDGQSITWGDGVSGDVVHTYNGDADTNGTITWDVTNDEFDFNAAITTTGVGQSSIDEGLVVNDDAGGTAAHSFQVKGDTNNYVIFTDAANDRVGICKNNPTVALDVTGSINESEDTTW